MTTLIKLNYLISQILIEDFTSPVTITFEERVIHEIMYSWAFENVRTQTPLFTRSHTLTDLSSEEVKMYFPLGWKLIPVTHWSWPSSLNTWDPHWAFHMITVLSQQPVATKSNLTIISSSASYLASEESSY